MISIIRIDTSLNVWVKWNDDDEENVNLSDVESIVDLLIGSKPSSEVEQTEPHDIDLNK